MFGEMVAVAVGSDVVVFADSGNDNGTADDAVILQGRSLAGIRAAQRLPNLQHRRGLHDFLNARRIIYPRQLH